MRKKNSLFFVIAFYSAVAVAGADSTTEASNTMMKNKLDFCCERDKTDESAQDMSEEQAHQIVSNTLAQTRPIQRPNNKTKAPSSGQR